MDVPKMLLQYSTSMPECSVQFWANGYCKIVVCLRISARLEVHDPTMITVMHNNLGYSITHPWSTVASGGSTEHVSLDESRRSYCKQLWKLENIQ